MNKWIFSFCCIFRWRSVAWCSHTAALLRRLFYIGLCMTLLVLRFLSYVRSFVHWFTQHFLLRCVSSSYVCMTEARWCVVCWSYERSYDFYSVSIGYYLPIHSVVLSHVTFHVVFFNDFFFSFLLLLISGSLLLLF